MIGVPATYIPNLLAAEWGAVSIGAGLTTVIALLRWLALKDHLDIASHALFLFFNVVVFTYAGLHGRDADTQMHFVTISLGAAFTFNYGKKLFLYPQVVLPLLLWIFLEIKGFELMQNDIYTPQDIILNSYINQVVFVGLLLFFSWVIIRQQNNFQRHYFRYKDDILAKQEALLSTNKELAETNHELDRINYTLSHDLRSPIASAKGLVSLMEIETQKEERDKLISILKQNLYRMDEYMEDVLLLAKGSKYQPQFEPIFLKPFIQRILDINTDFTRLNHIRVEVEIDNGLQLYTDPKLLRPILQNLISNAIKYHDADKLKPTIVIKAEIKDNINRISIWDNGLGISQPELDTIFERFKQSKSTRGGFGVGLYLVGEFIKSLGGDIDVQSKLGEYTDFIVLLPANRQ